MKFLTPFLLFVSVAFAPDIDYNLYKIGKKNDRCKKKQDAERYARYDAKGYSFYISMDEYRKMPA